MSLKGSPVSSKSLKYVENWTSMSAAPIPQTHEHVHSTGNRQHVPINGHPFAKRMDFGGPTVAARQTHLCLSQPAAQLPSPRNVL